VSIARLGNESFFAETLGCPFCRRPSDALLATVDYRDTAEAHPDLPNVEGRLYECADCGVAYPSHQYEIEAMPALYRKTFREMEFFDRTVMQRARKLYLKAILRGQHRRWSFARLLDHLSLHTLQAPPVTREPRGLRVLDVGCGFGEFLAIYRDLGNAVVGTEVLPVLVERLQHQGFDCRSGEIEDIDFGGQRFDVIILRAVFYRTRNPLRALETAKNLLSTDGEIALIDPCPGREGAEFFLRKQFPQGQFYIIDRERYLQMIERQTGLRWVQSRMTYGRPNAILKPIGFLQTFVGLGQLLAGNLFRYRPYTLSYVLRNGAPLRG